MTLRFTPGPGGGTHPVDWLSTHPGFAVSDVSACTACHGDDLAGGISNTSCFTAACHHEDPVWASAAAHGATAKRAPGSSGFKSCQICHAASFTGGGAQVSCLNNSACHGAGVQSPHASQWLPGDTYVHTTTDEGNAPVCALCHYNEPGAGAHTPTPPPAGVTVGCFNNTLCHGVGGVPAGTHETGWLDFDNSAAFHGSFVTQITCETAACHPISGHPTCTSCHFDNQGSRANPGLSFAHDGNVFRDHREESLASGAGTVCENCHQTSRTFRAGAPPSSCGPSRNHPGNEGCHSDPVIDQTLTNPRF